MAETAHPRPTHLTGTLLRLLPWILGLIAGTAFAAASAAASAAAGGALDGITIASALALAWYATESVRWLIAALRPPNRQVLLVYLAPRLVCSSISLAATYRLGFPWPETVLISLVGALLLETLARWGLQSLAQPLVQSAQARVAPAATAHDGRGIRPILAAVAASLFVLSFSLTSVTYLARETAFDARTWIRSLYDSGLYPALLRAAGDAALDAARNQRGDARQVAELLTEDDIRLAQQWALPEPWTRTWLQESLHATLIWMQSSNNQRVPPISIPISDIERHVKDAASLLLDQHLATQPLCTPDMPPSAYCRPAEMSVEAFQATYKPRNMAIADDILAQIPAELDLSTAVALLGTPLRTPIDDLNRARSAVHQLDRGLSIAGALSLAFMALLWMLCSTSRKSRLSWIGATLIAVALCAWVVGYAALALLPQRVFPEQSAGLPTHLSVSLQAFLRDMLETVHSRILVAALALAGLGLLLLWGPLLAPHKDAWTRRIAALQTARTGVILLAVFSVLWILYGQVGVRIYAQASQAHRKGDAEKAHSLYRQIVRLYPFRIPGPTEDWLARARQDRYECQLYLDAETAYRAADWQTAVQHYEALWLTQPPLSLRDAAQAHQVEALIRWARDLEAGGEREYAREYAREHGRERALDRYRFLRDEDLARDRSFDGQPIRIHRTIGALYLDWGDEQLSLDPEAAIATYRRALADTDDPGVWALAEGRMIEAYCAWNVQLRETNRTDRASGICTELGNEFPSLGTDPCAACAP